MADYNNVFCSNTDKRTDQVNLVLNAIAHGYRESFFKIQQSTLNISQEFKPNGLLRTDLSVELQSSYNN